MSLHRWANHYLLLLRQTMEERFLQGGNHHPGIGKSPRQIRIAAWDSLGDFGPDRHHKVYNLLGNQGF